MVTADLVRGRDDSDEIQFEMNDNSSRRGPESSIVSYQGIQETSQHDFLKEALKRAQIAWQKTADERNTVLGEITKQEETDDEEEFMEMALAETDNFVVYSNVEFLLLIGKYCAHSSQLADQGLKALNDYMLILEYHKGLMTQAQYVKTRALTLFHMGCIFYSQKDLPFALRCL